MREDILRERLKKLDTYKTYADPYPAEVRRDKTIAEVHKEFKQLTTRTRALFVAGRVMSVRNQGKIIFLDLQDETGSLQLILDHKQTVPFDIIKESLDIGDFVEVGGSVTTTKRGERSLVARKVRIISKSLRPLPSAWHGLEDVELKLRKRYLDMIMNPDTRELFAKKARFWQAVRSFIDDHDFFEVEMPVLEPVPGGAEAEPFITHLNALNQDYYLRISLELPLKKMLVGGIERVYEIGRIFRNEGIDWEHLQDYTQMECYAAYWDYEDMMKFIERLYKHVIKHTFGTLKLSVRGNELNWSGSWKRVDYYTAFKKETGLDLSVVTVPELKKKARELGLKVEKFYGRGRLIDLIYKKTVRPKLIQPCFLINPPIEVEPLAKRLADDPNRVARFQIVAAGTELGKGFSELNDPQDQRARFEEQMRLREEGDAEAQRIDEEFLEALEYGMPPAAGFGMSERLFAVLADRPVREAVIFPLMRHT